MAQKHGSPSGCPVDTRGSETSYPAVKKKDMSKFSEVSRVHSKEAEGK